MEMEERLGQGKKKEETVRGQLGKIGEKSNWGPFSGRRKRVNLPVVPPTELISPKES